MSVTVAAAAQGVQGTIRATSVVLEAIRNAQPRDGFPYKRLLNALPDSEVMVELVQSFTEDMVSLGNEGAEDQAFKALSMTTTALKQLHLSAQRIRSAVEMSSDFAAIDWWITERVLGFGLENKMILVAPGQLGDFHIEKTSAFRDHILRLGKKPRAFAQEGRLPEKLQASVDKLEDLHLLYVPSSNGISPAWRPLILGHELAHLTFTDIWVHDWLSRIQADDLGPLVDDAIDIAVNDRFQDRWFRLLKSWLVEVSCDSAAAYFYGLEGMVALSSHLATYGSLTYSDSHPSPETRYAIQAAGRPADLEPLRPDGRFDTDENQALDALLVLATILRDSVHEVLSTQIGIATDRAEAIAAATRDDLSNDDLPSAHSWTLEDLSRSATTLESGLVRGLWRRRQEVLAADAIDTDDLLDDESVLSQALDAVEFTSRFQANEELIETGKRLTSPLPNVLFLNAEGVCTSPDQEMGEPSHDIRLGRYFIVFQRNAVSELSSLGDPDPQPSPVQRGVEIGWGDEFVLHSGELVLAVTLEELRLSNDCVAQVLSRSSMGRLGLLSATAVHIQPGFVGCLTLELVNLASVPLRLAPGQRIAQVVPSPALGATSGYAGAYQNQRGKPQFSLARKDWDSEALRAIGS